MPTNILDCTDHRKDQCDRKYPYLAKHSAHVLRKITSLRCFQIALWNNMVKQCIRLFCFLFKPGGYTHCKLFISSIVTDTVAHNILSKYCLARWIREQWQTSVQWFQMLDDIMGTSHLLWYETVSIDCEHWWHDEWPCKQNPCHVTSLTVLNDL